MNTMNKTLIAGALIAASGAAWAESPHSLSANVALTTDYTFRGISQTDEDPAVQGGFDYGHASGFYAGIWASNVEQVAADGTISNIELDYYAGLGGDLGDSGLSYDVGFVYYDYPDVSAFDFWEVYGGLSYTFGGTDFEPTVGFTIYYSDDFFGGTDEAVYYNGTIDLALPQGFGFGASYGVSDFDSAANTDYDDWKIYLSKEWGGFGFELGYVDTDVDGALTDGRAVFTVSKSF